MVESSGVQAYTLQGRLMQFDLFGTTSNVNQV